MFLSGSGDGRGGYNDDSDGNNDNDDDMATLLEELSSQTQLSFHYTHLGWRP